MVFDAGTRRLDAEVALHAEQPVAELYVDARTTDRGMADRAVFLPERARIGTASPTHAHVEGLPYVEAFDPERMLGLGLVPVGAEPPATRLRLRRLATSFPGMTRSGQLPR